MVYIACTKKQRFLGRALNIPSLWSLHQNSVAVYHSSRLQGELLGYWVGPGEHPAVNVPAVRRKKCWLGTDFMLRIHFSVLTVITTECSQQPSPLPSLIPQAWQGRMVLLKQCLLPTSLLIHAQVCNLTSTQPLQFVHFSPRTKSLYKQDSCNLLVMASFFF